jgi:hypothetical protein
MDNDTDTNLDRDMDMESARDMDMVSDRVILYDPVFDSDMEIVNELLRISNVTQKIRETTVSKLIV